MFETALTVGVGLTVISNESFGPTQLLSVGVAMICAICGVATLALVNEILPEPEPAKPTAVFVFVHEIVLFAGTVVKFFINV